MHNVTSACVALESLDAGLTPNLRRQNRSSRFDRAFLYISSLKGSAGVATRFVGRLKRRVLSARVESALHYRTLDVVIISNLAH